jgi:DNA-binding HxlR family transcriptional regulator
VVAKWDGYDRFCSLARGLDVVGERWTLVILQELLHSPRRYSELRALLPGIGSNVLSERLRGLEHHNVVERIPGPVGEGVAYTLTQRGHALGPAMATFRQWGLDEMLPPTGSESVAPRTYDLSYAVPADIDMHESYQWRLDDGVYALRIDGQALRVERGPATRPAVALTTTRAFMRQWVAGETTWNNGRASGAVKVRASEAAWERMLLATGYPGRPVDLVERLRARHHTT